MDLVELLFHRIRHLIFMYRNQQIKLLSFVILCAAAFLSLSCGTFYKIVDDRPDDINRYLTEFQDEGRERGVDIQYPRHMRIRLVDYMTGSTIGHCSRDIPIRIDLDREFWNNADDIQRRIIFFHELGHCILERSHLNDTLGNGEWKSLMRGTPLPEGRNFGINLRDYRKDYYLNELFDPGESPPEWSLIANAPEVIYPLKQVITFDQENALDNWRFSDSTRSLPYIEDRRLVIDNSNNNSSVTISRNIAFDARQPLRFEAYIKSGFDRDSSGVILFFRNDARLEYFLLHRSTGMSFGSTNEFRPYTILPVPKAELGETVRMSIEQYRDRLYYTLNDRLVYVNHASLPSSDSLIFGISLQSQTTAKIDSLIIFGSGSPPVQ